MPIPSVGARLARASLAYGSIARTRAGVGAMHPFCWRYALGPSRRYDSTLRVAPSVSSSARVCLRTRANGEQQPIPPNPPNSIHRGSKSSDPCSYFIKPREPTILSHKEYHEISSTNLLLPLVVRLPLPNDTPQSDVNPSSRGIVFDRAHSSRALEYRKVQYRTGRSIVKLSPPCGETGQAGYTRQTLGGMPPLPSFPRIELTAESRFG